MVDPQDSARQRGRAFALAKATGQVPWLWGKRPGHEMLKLENLCKTYPNGTHALESVTLGGERVV